MIRDALSEEPPVARPDGPRAVAPGPGPSLAAQLLRLQRTAGNAAVARALGRQRLARDGLNWPPGKDPKSGYWDLPNPSELGAKIADDLLSDPKYAGLAPGVLNGGWILFMVDSVEAIRAKGKLDVLALTAVNWPRVQFVIALVRDPAAFNSATVLASIPNHGIPADQVKEVESRQIDLAMTQFATDRKPLADAMRSATGDAARKTAMDAVKAFDDKRLPALEKLTTGRGADRWKHTDPTVGDAILAAIQLRGVYGALSDLDKPNADVAARARTGHGAGENWCGFFVTDAYRLGSFDDREKALLGSFDSTLRVWAFFTYLYGAVTGRFPKYVRTEDGSWEEVAKYHEKRGSKRQWIPTSGLAAGHLDIRPGDILTLAVPSTDKRDPADTPEQRATKEADMNKEKAYGDHIVMVLSYDPATGRLFTIGGNDGGYVVRTGAPPATESADAKATREARESASGKQLQLPTSGGGHVGVGFQDLTHQAAAGAAGSIVLHVHVAGIGRPSIVDFEQHDYADKLPAASK